jgi:hypothetical protein
MNTRSYAAFFAMVFVVTVFSFVYEYYYPSIRELENTHFLGLFFFRYIHYMYLIYFTIFLLFFKVGSIDAVVFLVLSVIMTASWMVFDCCIASYYELKMYYLNHRDFETRFHPCLFALFGEYQWIPLTITGFCMVVTFYYILLKTRRMPFVYKVPLGVIFAYLFAANLVKTRYYDTALYYPKSSDHVLYRWFTFC